MKLWRCPREGEGSGCAQPGGDGEEGSWLCPGLCRRGEAVERILFGRWVQLLSLCSSGFLAARVGSLLFTVYGFVSFNYCEVPRCSGGQRHKHLGSKYITKCT